MGSKTAARTARLKRLCRRHDLDWQALMRLTGRKRSTVRGWLNGSYPVPEDTLALLVIRLDGAQP